MGNLECGGGRKKLGREGTGEGGSQGGSGSGREWVREGEYERGKVQEREENQ